MEEWLNGKKDCCLKMRWKDGAKRGMERVYVRNGRRYDCLRKAVYPDYWSGFGVIRPHQIHFCDGSSGL